MRTHDYYGDTGPGNIALMRSLLAEGQKPDPIMAREALATFCRRVREGDISATHNSRDLLAWIADAVSEYLRDPDRRDGLEHALHVRGRAQDPEVQARYWSIAMQVEQLVRAGHPVTDNQAGTGALATVAERVGMSEPEVRKIYYGFAEQERDAMFRIHMLMRCQG